jgi:hypothetical protein
VRPYAMVCAQELRLWLRPALPMDTHTRRERDGPATSLNPARGDGGEGRPPERLAASS